MYGPVLPVPDHYEAALGLLLNVERVRAEQAAGQASAFALALGGEPDPGFLHALAHSTEEARNLAAQTRADRRWQAALARHGFAP